MTDIRYFDVKEVAEIIRHNPKTVLRYFSQGILPGNKVGNKWLISQGALRAWIAKQPKTKRA